MSRLPPCLKTADLQARSPVKASECQWRYHLPPLTLSFTLAKQKIFENPNKSADFALKTNLVARCKSYVNEMCR
jgi:hypothetical protein